jgi:hypothetical protein
MAMSVEIKHADDRPSILPGRAMPDAVAETSPARAEGDDSVRFLPRRMRPSPDMRDTPRDTLPKVLICRGLNQEKEFAWCDSFYSYRLGTRRLE